jgi:hypothetical protein
MDDDGNLNSGAFSRRGGRRDRLPSSDELPPLARAYRARREHSGTITSRRSPNVTDLELLAYQLRLSVREVTLAIDLGLIKWPRR